ncbi:MAG: sodium-dependent transporter [Simkaniaceae bacterium]|nr:sodium-dependent transporter [Simkaniaceae bacterium]
MKAQREHWASQFGFIMAAAGSAIGLGSLWRFPYIAGDNGGGAFVLLYIIFTYILGVPIFLGELLIGRKTQKSPIFAYQELAKPSKNWRMIGYLNLLTSFILLSFYCVVSGWCLNYALLSLNQFSLGKSPQEIRAIFDTVYTSADINIFWLIIFILLNIGVVYNGIRKGIEHWSKILTPALLFILIAMFIYNFTMPGFSQAVTFIFYPTFSKLTPSVVLNALGMAFFTVSVGLGIIVTYGSYLKPSENMPKTAFIVATMTILVSLMAALMIFPIVFTFNFPPEGGPGLVFKTMPILFSKLPGSLVISTVFFLLFVFTALTSSISLLEVLVANLMELLNWKRGKAVLVSALGVFIFGIPSALAGSKVLFPHWEAIYGKDFFDTMNYISASWMIPVAALFTTFFIGYVMEKELTREEFLKGTQLRFFFRPWFFMLRYIAPLAVLVIILEQAGIVNLSYLLNLITCNTVNK